MNVQNVLPRDAIPSIDDPVFGSEYVGEADDEVIVVDGVARSATERASGVLPSIARWFERRPRRLSSSRKSSISGRRGSKDESSESSGERSKPRDDGDPPRAYPIRILSYHEIVNDEIDGVLIAVTWCPICWSAIVYDRTIDGRILTFGTSGKLADDALVTYDRETGSEWKQPTGEAIAGEFESQRLTALPAPVMSWKRFRNDNPDGVVLQPVRGTADETTGIDPAGEYDMAPCERYVESEAFGLYGMRGTGEPRSWDRDDIDAKTVVLGVEHGDEAVGFPIPHVEAAGGVVTDSVGDLDVVVFATEDGIHAFENPGFEFEPAGDGFRADGVVWDGTTGQSTDGRRLTRVPARRLFAFAWQDAHGPSTFYRPSPY